MNQSTEQQLRDLFASDAADAPHEQAVAAAAIRQVHRRRRTLTIAAATAALLIAAGAYAVNRPPATPPLTPPQAQPPAASPTPLTSAPPPAAALPPGAKPGDPLTFAAAQCVKPYSPKTLAEQAFAFDGTVTAIAPAQTNRNENPSLDLRSVTFEVHTWFKGGSTKTTAVDMSPPGVAPTPPDATSEHTPTYQIGTRLLVSGTPRWGGPPLTDPIAWPCGFTRYYSPTTATEWTKATK
ncbi:hypothetical protein OWR29_24790 [Actinoplanes sp. Pm04-4]|uniref:Uncharacterized protein n=1 Tax=Paractinoplanes pyxinae TaxID=2997416 RepID=A0ABT4B401_9ACTN|nr:hypothetical protein [Actinoplanes pyxinae]MCY1141228.1 hypothetical protein [Actinoplanes pyxinae]